MTIFIGAMLLNRVQCEVIDIDGLCLLIIASSHLFDNFAYPPGHPEQVSVEAVLPVAIAALSP